MCSFKLSERVIAMYKRVCAQSPRSATNERTYERTNVHWLRMSSLTLDKPAWLNAVRRSSRAFLFPDDMMMMMMMRVCVGDIVDERSYYQY